MIEKRVNTIDGAREQFGVNLVLVLKISQTRHRECLGELCSSGCAFTPGCAAAPYASRRTRLLQDQVFDKVATSLELQLEPQEKQSLASHGTTERTSHFYTQGRGYLQDYVVPEKSAKCYHSFLGRACHALRRRHCWARRSILAKIPADARSSMGRRRSVHLPKGFSTGSSFPPPVLVSAALSARKGVTKKLLSSIRRASLFLSPAATKLMAELAAAYEKLGRLEEAEKLYKQGITVRDPLLGYLQVGWACFTCRTRVTTAAAADVQSSDFARA